MFFLSGEGKFVENLSKGDRKGRQEATSIYLTCCIYLVEEISFLCGKIQGIVKMSVAAMHSKIHSSSAMLSCDISICYAEQAC